MPAFLSGNTGISTTAVGGFPDVLERAERRLLPAGMERPPDSIEGIPLAVRWLPLAVVFGWLAVAAYAVAYVLSR